jgi:hypothetical protein
VSGHDFSRADNALRRLGVLTPAELFSGILLEFDEFFRSPSRPVVRRVSKPSERSPTSQYSFIAFAVNATTQIAAADAPGRKGILRHQKISVEIVKYDTRFD